MKSKLFVFAVILLLFTVNLFAQGYKKPPKEILDILDAPAIPISSVSPAKDKVALFTPLRYPPIADLAEPMLRLAGLRINPKNNSRYGQRYFVELKLKNISDDKEMTVNLPTGAKLISPNWSADGKYIAAGNLTDQGVELWIIETATGKANKLNGIQVNTAFGGFDWMPDQRSLLVNLVPSNRGKAPETAIVPTSPNIQETSGRPAAIRTFQDLLASPNDEKLFDYYATSQLAIVGFASEITGKIKLPKSS